MKLLPWLGLLVAVAVAYFWAWPTYQELQAQYEREEQERIAAIQQTADDMRGVVTYCWRSRGSWRCDGSAVMLSERVAITASHVAEGDEVAALLFADGTMSLVQALYRPDYDTLDGADEYPVLLAIDSPEVSHTQPFATIGPATPDASFMGQSRFDVQSVHSDINLTANMTLANAVGSSRANHIYYETVDTFEDTACSGDSGGALFSVQNNLFALLRGIEEARDEVDYRVGNEMVSCRGGIRMFVELAPYEAWIEQTLTRF